MKTILIIFFSFFCITCFAQDATSQNSLVKIDQLDFMEGTWKGEGWIYINKQRKEFTQSETIKSKVGNTVLVIDGLGHAKEDKTKVIHDAFGVISYNDEKKAMTMISFASTGGKMENEMKLIGDKQLEWSFKDERGGTIRFREDFSKDGEWIEKGEYSFDGEKWFPFFEMHLKRQKE